MTVTVTYFISNLAAQWLSVNNAVKHCRFFRDRTHVHNFLAESFYCAGLTAVRLLPSSVSTLVHFPSPFIKRFVYIQEQMLASWVVFQAHAELIALASVEGTVSATKKHQQQTQYLWCHCYISRECVAIKWLFFISVFQTNWLQVLYKPYTSWGRQADALETLYALSRICEDRLLTPMCLSVCSPVWNKSTSLDFLEIFYCGLTVVVDINSVKAKFYILLTVHLDITSGRWPTWRTILLYNTFISILYMFRATSCSSSQSQLY